MKPRHDDRLLSELYLKNSLMYFILRIASTLSFNIKDDLLLMSHCEKWQTSFWPDISSQQNIQ